MVKNNILIDNARIGFRNFAGKEGKFNPAGRRNFCVFLDNDIARKLEEDGWNVRWLDPKDEYEEKQAYLQVAVLFGKIQPLSVIISSKGKTVLNEKTIEMLDWVEIANDEKTNLPLVDLIIRPYNWVLHEGTKNEKRGVKAYLKSIYVTMAEDKYAMKYHDVPDSAADSIGGCGECDACTGKCNSDD